MNAFTVLARGEMIPPMPSPIGWAVIGFIALCFFVIYMIGRNGGINTSPPDADDWTNGRSVPRDPTRPRSPDNRPR